MEATKLPVADHRAGPSLLGLDSAALMRLMEEVRNDAVSSTTAYNRTHNRHNR